MIARGSNGTLTLKNVATSTTIGTSSALSTNTLYRVGIRQASGSGTGALQAHLATGDAAFGAAFASSTAETIGNPAAEVRIGATNSTAVDATVDDIRLDSAAMPGPSTGGSATATPTRTPTPTNTPTGPTVTPTNTATPTLTPTPAPAAPPPYDETYTYDAIGNLTSKAGISRTYGPTNSGPHQARNVGGQTYSYDANGNLQSDGNRTFIWNADNLPASVTNGGMIESYTYDADGERVAKTVGGVTTVYFQGPLGADRRSDVHAVLHFSLILLSLFSAIFMGCPEASAPDIRPMHASNWGSKGPGTLWVFLAGGAGVAAHPCRPPRRRTAFVPLTH